MYGLIGRINFFSLITKKLSINLLQIFFNNYKNFNFTYQPPLINIAYISVLDLVFKYSFFGRFYTGLGHKAIREKKLKIFAKEKIELFF